MRKKMRTVTIKIEGLTAYSASKYFEPNVLKGETKDAHEKRRWREKAHLNDAGTVYVPGVAFKLALDETAQLLNEKIPGKGNQTWTGQFATGVVAMSDVDLGIKADEMKAIQIFAHANGKRGPGTRVMRFFPYITTWGGELEMRVFNDTLPEDVFERFFTQAGLLAGVGRGRPITKSPAGNGRFRPVKFTWANG
jgi:hypothetical protein